MHSNPKPWNLLICWPLGVPRRLQLCSFLWHSMVGPNWRTLRPLRPSCSYFSDLTRLTLKYQQLSFLLYLKFLSLAPLPSAFFSPPPTVGGRPVAAVVPLFDLPNCVISGSNRRNAGIERQQTSIGHLHVLWDITTRPFFTGMDYASKTTSLTRHFAVSFASGMRVKCIDVHFAYLHWEHLMLFMPWKKNPPGC